MCKHCYLLIMSPRSQYDGCMLRSCCWNHPLTCFAHSNIWGPNKQTDLVDHVAAKYKFSRRLLAVIKTTPPAPKPQNEEKHTAHLRTMVSRKVDLEANPSLDSSRHPSPIRQPADTSHYTIAKEMIQYHSIDVGPRCKFWCNT